MADTGNTHKPRGQIHYADNMEILKNLSPGSVDLIYIDPPFNTGKSQDRTHITITQDEHGDRVGFQGKRYVTVKKDTTGYRDQYDDYLGFLRPPLEEAYRVLASHGSFYLHIDYREVHYVKVLLDEIFGRECFKNEIIWAYDFGGKPRTKWPAKHDNILFYVKDPNNYVFNVDDIERIPYMAPGLVTPEKAAMGKLPTDTWWHTIVATNGKERIGYSTQKPLGILKRILTASSNTGDLVLDFFAGSGTTGEAAFLLDRRFILVDNNVEALEVMARRFNKYPYVEFVGYEPGSAFEGTKIMF